MHRVTVKVERFVSTGRIAPRAAPEDRYSAELMVVATGTDQMAALEKAIRILTGELDILKEELPTIKKFGQIGNPDDEEEEPED